MVGTDPRTQIVGGFGSKNQKSEEKPQTRSCPALHPRNRTLFPSGTPLSPSTRGSLVAQASTTAALGAPPELSTVLGFCREATWRVAVPREDLPSNAEDYLGNKGSASLRAKR